MAIVIIIVAAILIGYPLLSMKMKRNSKNCSGCNYKYTSEDLESYRGEQEGVAGTSFVYVTLKCPKCGKKEEKCIKVNTIRGIEQGIIDYFQS